MKLSREIRQQLADDGMSAKEIASMDVEDCGDLFAHDLKDGDMACRRCGAELDEPW